jgi:hypothetical protein
VGNKQPGSVTVLFANPRWERRLPRFLGESRVGRIIESGEDENEIQAVRMDGWIAWEHEERVEGG